MNYDIAPPNDGFQTTLSADPTTLTKVTKGGFIVNADGNYKLVTANGTTLTDVPLIAGLLYPLQIKAAYKSGSPVLTGFYTVGQV